MAAALDKITIVGLGPGTRKWMKHYGAGTVDSGFILSINECHSLYGFNPDTIIAMDDLKRDEKTHPEYVKSIVNQGCPVIVCTTYPQWSRLIAYPLKEIIEFYKLPVRFASKVLNNTCCYALAWAGFKGARTIKLVGYDFVQPDDKEMVLRAIDHRAPGEPMWFPYYTWGQLIRRPSEPGLEAATFWCGMLNGLGIHVVIDPTATFFDGDRPDFFYGFQEQPEIDG